MATMTGSVRKVRFVRRAVVRGPSYNPGEGAAFPDELAADLVARGVVVYDGPSVAETGQGVVTEAAKAPAGPPQDKMARSSWMKGRTPWNKGLRTKKD